MAASSFAKLLALSALCAALLLAAPARAVDVDTCSGLIESMGGGAGLMGMAPGCNTAGPNFSIGSCCSQIKSLLSASGPTGSACMCDPAVFAQFSAQISIPGFSNSAIPFFLTNMCRIPNAGTGC